MLTWKEIINFSVSENPKPDKRVEKSSEEWCAILTDEQFRITRKKGTEMTGTGEICSSHEAGKYNCVCCDTLLFFEAEKEHQDFYKRNPDFEYCTFVINPKLAKLKKLHTENVNNETKY